MIQGTTQTIKCNFKQIPVNTLTEAYLTIRTTNGRKIEKDITSMHTTTDPHIAYWKLTQEESLLLTEDNSVQVRYKTSAGTGHVGASGIYQLTAGNIIKKGAI